MANILQQNPIAYQIDGIIVPAYSFAKRVTWTIPDLPETVTIDTDEAVISGVFPEAGNIDLNVSVETNYGTATGTIRVNVS